MSGKAEFRRTRGTVVDVRSSGRAARLVALLVGAGVMVVSATSYAETTAPRRVLASATSRLVPYDVRGTTLEALSDLDLLIDSLDETVEQRARFLRAAAPVELFVVTQLLGDDEGRSTLATALGTTPDGLSSALVARCDAASDGPFARDVQSYRVVASCVDDADLARCSVALRRIADAASGASTAARLLLLARAVTAAEQSRRADFLNAASPLAAVATPLCRAGWRREGRDVCEAGGGREEAAVALAQAVMEQAFRDIGALEAARTGDDPLVAATSEWLDRARTELGWLAFQLPLEASDVPDGTFPRASAQPTSMPLELLVLSSSRGATFALSPVLVVDHGGSARLDDRAGLALPGKNVLAAPFSFRPVVQPIREVTKALTTLRADVDSLVENLDDGGPSWLTAADRTLGVLIDEDMMMTDVARFIWSAREAGYERFALIGRRDDGRLTAIPIDFRRDGAGDALPTPRVTVGPTSITVVDSRGAITELQRSDPGVGAAVARGMNESDPRFSIQAGRPWMEVGRVLATLDAVVAAVNDRGAAGVLNLP